MSTLIIDILIGYSILIAAGIGIIRFNSIANEFYPFLFMTRLGTLNETLSLVFIFTTGSNTVNSNIFVLPEYLLIVYQFYRWSNGAIKKYAVLALLGVALWITDNLVLNTVNDNNGLFRAFLAFVAVFLSMDQVNKLLICEREPLYKNSAFIICVGFLLYFGFKAFIESYNMFHPRLSPGLLRHLWIILYIVNGIANLLYALAVLWMPSKIKFTLPY